MAEPWQKILDRLTPAQRRVLDAMCKLEDENDGWHVPLALVARRLGNASTSTVLVHVEHLVALGAAEKSPFAGGGYRAARRPHPGDIAS